SRCASSGRPARRLAVASEFWTMAAPHVWPVLWSSTSASCSTSIARSRLPASTSNTPRLDSAVESRASLAISRAMAMLCSKKDLAASRSPRLRSVMPRLLSSAGLVQLLQVVQGQQGPPGAQVLNDGVGGRAVVADVQRAGHGLPHHLGVADGGQGNEEN